MNKVITIDLNGRAYQLDEAGYEALRVYLDEAAARLSDDPGKMEIIADLEQAIAEKCDKLLSPNKTVVSTEEVKRIIDEMGPVEGEEKKGSAENEAGKAHARAPRRFFLIREDAVLAGVCAGLAAYFNIDVTVVRVGFVALTVFTGGIWILCYIALALFVPYADTAETMAQAHGEPFNAEALVQRAKERWSEGYERVTGSKWDDAQQHMQTAHDAHLKWRQARKQQRRQWKQQIRSRMHYAYHPNPFFGLLRAALAIVWILAELSLVSSGTIFGSPIPAGIPVWAAIIILFILYQAVTGPMKGARHGYGQYGGEYYYSESDGFMDGLTVLFLAIAFIWAYLNVPQFYAFVHHPIGDGIHPLIAWLRNL